MKKRTAWAWRGVFRHPLVFIRLVWRRFSQPIFYTQQRCAFCRKALVVALGTVQNFCGARCKRLGGIGYKQSRRRGRFVRVAK